MWPYFALLGLLLTGALLTPPDLRRVKPIGFALLLGALVVMLFVGLRNHIGTDWPTYERQWNAAGDLPLPQLMERYGGDVGFYVLMWSLANVGVGFWVLNLVCAAIFTWGLFAFAKRLPNPWLAVAVAFPYLVVAIAMSSTRQATAMGFIFLAVIAFSKRQTSKFLGWSALAALFHASAIVTVPFAGLSFARNKFQAFLIGVCVVIIGWFTLGSSFETYTLRYTAPSMQSVGLLYRVAMSAVAAVLYFLVIRRNLALEEHEQTLWRNYALFALAAVVLAAVFPTSTALDRTLIYLFPMQIFVLSMVPYVFQRGTHPALVILGLLPYLVAIMAVFLSYGVNAPSYIPYKMYWPG